MHRHLRLFLLSIVFAGLLFLTGCPQTTEDTRALVLVNSNSPSYSGFLTRTAPYLDNFGVPYAVLDLATGEVTNEVEAFAVILVGHVDLDPDGIDLAVSEQEAISEAVRNGVGLVNFDNRLTDAGGAPRYAFVQDLFEFEYGQPTAGSGVDLLPEGTHFLPCWDDAHQDPVLSTTTDASELIGTDGQWTEFLYEPGGRRFPSIFAGVDEAGYGLPVMRFYAGGIENGTYEIRANLYRSGAGHELRYYYGFTEEEPTSQFVDAVGGSVGPYQHVEYRLGSVEISDGTFDLFVQDADLLSGTYPFFGWAWISLVPVGAVGPEAHYITARHTSGERIVTGEMSLAGISSCGALDADVPATTGNQPFLVAVRAGEGRAVQWGSIDWMSHEVKGPVAGLDDLLWRSLVWAARKPFVMQCMPPYVVMRVDDASGPFWWVETAGAYGLTPWAGVFLHDMDEEESTHLSALVAEGRATVSVHANTSNDFFYYDHAAAGNRPDEAVVASFEEATLWHQEYGIPVSSFVLPHYYEFGTNVFQGLADWGVEFVGTHMEPAAPYVTGTPWLTAGPYRLHGTPLSCREVRPVYYADFIDIPGHPEFEGRFFNCVTEIRDDAGYEWYPNSNVEESIGRGVRQVSRALDSKVLAALFTHEQHIQPIASEDWESILDGVVSDLEPLGPIYVSLDYAVKVQRALVTSAVESSGYHPLIRRLDVSLSGETDLETSVTVFLDSGDGAGILETVVPVPVFQGTAEIKVKLP